MSSVISSNEIARITDAVRDGSQNYIIATIFEKNPNTPLGKRYIEREYALRVAFKDVTDEQIASISSKRDLLAIANDIPGDVQRVLRCFFDNYKQYGIVRNGERATTTYTYTPKTIAEMEPDMRVNRNIFRNDNDKNEFIKSRKNACEVCGKHSASMAIDHWRAHSVYNIDNVGIAVLLCGTCNNVHHNRDASHLISKYSNDITVVKNWIKIERRIRENGFRPNENDREDQKINIQAVKDQWRSNGMTLDEQFWCGLDA